MKKISRQDQIGAAGIALISTQVLAMGHVWHERKTDAGIDGEIELRNPATGEVRNHILLVQSKAGNRAFPGENDESFHYIVDERDLQYWLEGNAPVILVCSHPESGEAWWLHINEYFSDPSRRESRKAVFDKATQALDKQAAAAIASLAAPAGSGIYLGAAPRTETILTNLLPLEHPESVYWVPTNASDPRTLGPALRDAGLHRGNWLLSDGHLFSFQPFRERAWNQWLEGPEMTQATSFWLDTDDRNERHRAIDLIGREVRQQFHRHLAWDRNSRLLYFKATDDLAPRKIAGRGMRERTVFRAYMKKQDPTALAYYRHDAVDLRWLATETGWVAQLNPTYYFSNDGRAPYPWAADQLKGIKQLERAGAVEGSVRMWASFLRGDRPQLAEAGRSLRFAELLEFESEHGIDDSNGQGNQRYESQAELAPVEIDPGDIAHLEDGWDEDGQGGLW